MIINPIDYAEPKITDTSYPATAPPKPKEVFCPVGHGWGESEDGICPFPNCEYRKLKRKSETLSDKLRVMNPDGEIGTTADKIEESIKEILFHKKCRCCGCNHCQCGNREWVIDVNVIKEEFGDKLI